MQKKNLHLTVRHALKQYKRYKRKYGRLSQSASSGKGKLDFLLKRIERLKTFLKAALQKQKLATAAGALALTLSVSTADAQTFNAPVTNPFGLTSVYNFAVPTMADLDGDGDLDMMVGESYYGNFYYFENTGTATAPSFGAAQTNPFGLSTVGAYSYSTPVFADLDGDGDFDLMVGSNNGGGNLYYFENTGSSTVPSFGAAQTNPFGITLPSGYYGSVLYYSDPALTDLDGDGDLDLMVGNDYYGTLYYYENTGTSSAPAFAAPVGDPFSLTTFDNATTPSFADFDSDGDMDLFSGEGSGNVYYIENTGTSSAPVFGTELLNPFAGMADVGSYSNLDVKDIDGDGDFDLLVGASDGNIYFFENVSCTPPVAPTNTTNVADMTICDGETTMLTASGTGTIGWYDAASGGSYLGGGSAYTTPILSADMTYYVQDSTCAESPRTAVTVTVNPLPDVTTTTAGATVTANLAGATSYQWVNCPAYTTASGSSTGQSYAAVTNGDYAVIINNGGCTDTSGCVSISSVGINDLSNNNQLSVFPNPSTGSFTIQSSVPGHYVMTNDMGQVVQTFELNAGNSYSLKIEGLSTGVYFVTGISNKDISRHKIIVTK